LRQIIHSEAHHTALMPPPRGSGHGRTEQRQPPPLRRDVPFGFFMLDVTLPTLRKKRASQAADFAQRAARAAEAAVIFRRFDVDGDGILNREEMKAAATAVCPDEAWDEALWDDFCIEFEADPTYGFDHEAFERFRAAMGLAHPGAPSGEALAALPKLDWPDDWPATEVRLATTAFVEHDIDGDSHLNLREMRGLVEDEHPTEEWDDDEWEPMCEHLGVLPDVGLSFEAFLRFRLSVIEAEAQQAWDSAVGAGGSGEEEAEEGSNEVEVAEAEYMSAAQVKEWALAAAQTEGPSGGGGDGTRQQGAAAAWDDALWPQLCESYGADSARGFNWDQFLALFRTRQATVEAREHLAAVQAAAEKAHARAEQEMFERYDLDADGFLNLEEMGLAALQVTEKTF
jgi:Ca2+-binding EF-hand superfamily protein